MGHLRRSGPAMCQRHMTFVGVLVGALAGTLAKRAVVQLIIRQKWLTLHACWTTMHLRDRQLRSKRVDQPKVDFLRSRSLLNPRPERVTHPLFDAKEFFDRRDLPQVRYEMLRAARVEPTPVAEACRLFGFSREYFYRLERAFTERGYAALLGSPMGRPPLLALNQEIVNFIVHRKIEQPEVSGEELRKEILQLYKVDCSRRTVERIIAKVGVGKRGPRGR